MSAFQNFIPSVGGQTGKYLICISVSTLSLLIGWQKGYAACKTRSRYLK